MSYTKAQVLAMIEHSRFADPIAYARKLKEIESIKDEPVSKYGVAAKEDRTWIDHHGRLGKPGSAVVFDSKKELRRWFELLMMEAIGEITDLKRQVPYKYCIGDKLVTTYVADFTYLKDKTRHVEDVKGYKKGVAYQMFRLKKGLIENAYEVTITEL